MAVPRLVAGILSVPLTVLGAVGVYGQDYPSKPLRIVTSAAGGSQDFTSRLIAQGLSGPLGQQVIVDNRGGGIVPGETASKAPPDGYTLLLAGGSFWLAPLLRKAPYDPVKDFAPVTLTIFEPNILVVHPSVPVKSVKELIALAKAKPGALNFSYGSVGGSGYIAAELFKSMAGIKIQGIAYKSDAQEIGELLGGYVQITFQGGVKVGPHIKSGKLRALAVTSEQPTALAPGLPTVAASLPGFVSVALTGIFAPAKTPGSIINRLSQEIVRVLNQPDVKQKFFDAGVEVVGGSPEQLAAAMKSEIARAEKIIKDAGIKVE